jgi:hypothetical protein
MFNIAILFANFKFVFLNLVALFFFISEPVFSQKADFSGTWIIKDQKSVSGTLYHNGVPKQLKVIQKADCITIDKITIKDSSEDITTTETIGFDGKPFETYTPSRRKKMVLIKWEDNSQCLVEIASYSSAANEKSLDYKITDTWILSDSGKKLILTRVNESNIGESWTMKAIYDKQEVPELNKF